MKALATAVLTMAAVTGAPLNASAADAPSPVVGVEIVGTNVDYAAAAESEAMAVPTTDYRLSARFGQSGSMWSSGHHTGLDFAAPVGTKVKAADSGQVIGAGPAGAYGNLIEIAHGDGTHTRYAHLSDIDVEEGDRVRRGQHIGDLGSTGNSSGPHLHFEVLVKDKQVDPAAFLNL